MEGRRQKGREEGREGRLGWKELLNPLRFDNLGFVTQTDNGQINKRKCIQIY
jgi:hypothetical protein